VAQGGRGGFNRVHTCFHPVDAVEPSDVRFCTADYQQQLVDTYAFLFDLVNQLILGYHVGSHLFFASPVVARVKTPRGPSNNILRYEVFDALYLTSGSRRWGTMRRRGAVVRH